MFAQINCTDFFSWLCIVHRLFTLMSRKLLSLLEKRLPPKISLYPNFLVYKKSKILSQVASHRIFTLLPGSHTNISTHKHRCQAGWNYQRSALTCPTTFPRNHGERVVDVWCVYLSLRVCSAHQPHSPSDRECRPTLQPLYIFQELNRVKPAWQQSLLPLWLLWNLKRNQEGIKLIHRLTRAHSSRLLPPRTHKDVHDCRVWCSPGNERISATQPQTDPRMKVRAHPHDAQTHTEGLSSTMFHHPPSTVFNSFQ